MINVACGQVQDVFLEHHKEASLDTIVQMYVDKTSRYTFSLPMILFCHSTNQKKERINIYNNLARYMGILYQIVDDELGILGNDKITGKPVGSDFTGLKKNIYWFYLKKKDFPFSKYQENFDIHEIRNFIIQNNIQRNVQEYKENVIEKIENLINKLPTEKEIYFFIDIKKYIKDRKK